MNSDWEQEVVGTHRHLVASQQPPSLVVSGKQSPRFSGTSPSRLLFSLLDMLLFSVEMT